MKTSMDPKHLSLLVDAVRAYLGFNMSPEYIFDFLALSPGAELVRLCIEVPELQPYLVDMIIESDQLVELLFWWHQNPDKCFVDIDSLFDRFWQGDAVVTSLLLWRKMNETTARRTPAYLALQRHMEDFLDRMIMCPAAFRRHISKRFGSEIKPSYRWIRADNLSLITRNFFPVISIFLGEDAEILIPRIQKLEHFLVCAIFRPEQAAYYKLSPRIVHLCYDYFQQFKLKTSYIAEMARLPGAKDDMFSRIHTASAAFSLLTSFGFDEQKYLPEFIDVILTDPDRELVGFLLRTRRWPDFALLIDSVIDPLCACDWVSRFPSDAPIMNLRLRYTRKRNRP